MLFFGLSAFNTILFRTFGILLGDFVFVACLCGPKLNTIYHNKHNSKSIVSYQVIEEAVNPLLATINALSQEIASLKHINASLLKEMRAIKSTSQNSLSNMFSFSHLNNTKITPQCNSFDESESAILKQPFYSCDDKEIVHKEESYTRQRPLIYSTDFHVSPDEYKAQPITIQDRIIEDDECEEEDEQETHYTCIDGIDIKLGFTCND
jgi:hypothetical protein